MTYIPQCGRKYFRNRDYSCGETAPRPCNCFGSQNSHIRLLATFGAGEALPIPTVSIQVPTDGAIVQPTFSVFAFAMADRGVARVELWLNGYKWVEVPGPRPDQQGGVFTLTTPASVPDGIIDIEVRGVDDLGTGYGTANITVTKGAPCTDASTCADGQECDMGRCSWDPPVGELGQDCDYDQYCLSGVCRGTCTEACFPGVTGDCPVGFECAPEGSGGFCVEGGGGDGGGCCSTSVAKQQSIGNLLAQLGLAGLVLGGALARRRRRRN